MRTDQLRAVIYLAAYLMEPGEVTRWMDLCADYCRRHGYVVAEVVTDHQDGQAWLDVLKAVSAGRGGQAGAWRADVVVVPDRSLLPPDRVPRLEVVTDEDLGI